MAAKNSNPRGRPPVDSERIGVRMQRPLLDALDKFIEVQSPLQGKELTRPEAIRLLMVEALAKNGLWKP